MVSARDLGVEAPDRCARCGNPAWHPVLRSRGRVYHLSCDPGDKGGPCRYCGQPKNCRDHDSYDPGCHFCGWQFSHECDEAALIR